MGAEADIGVRRNGRSRRMLALYNVSSLPVHPGTRATCDERT
jgi:hypothetical protein